MHCVKTVWIRIFFSIIFFSICGKKVKVNMKIYWQSPVNSHIYCKCRKAEIIKNKLFGYLVHDTFFRCFFSRSVYLRLRTRCALREKCANSEFFWSVFFRIQHQYHNCLFFVFKCILKVYQLINSPDKCRTKKKHIFTIFAKDRFHWY